MTKNDLIKQYGELFDEKAKGSHWTLKDELKSAENLLIRLKKGKQNDKN